MPSRRTLLAGAAGLGGLGAFGTVAASLSFGPVESWSPAPDTWPLRRYSPAGTAATSATAPTDPAIDWDDRPLDGDGDPALVVGPERVYAADTDTVALDRSDGRTAWDGEAGGRLAVRDGTVFVVPEETDSAEPLVALDADDGSVRWRTGLSGEKYATGDPLPAGGRLYVLHGDGVSAYDVTNGSERWSATSPGADGLGLPTLAVADGRLHACADTIVRFGTRSALDGLTRAPPAPEWERDGPDTVVGAAVATGSLLVAGTDRVDVSEELPARGRLRRLDVGDGGRTWEATVDPDGAAESLVEALAVAGDRCLTGERRGERAAVASRRLVDGGVAWRRPVEGGVEDLAVAGDTVLAATGGDRVRAFALADGTERWSVRVWEVRRVAPVEGTVFALTRAGRVAALR